MSDSKMECPSCHSWTNAIGEAARNGEACPSCGADLPEWRHRRTVTTLEELDDLPDGAVILDAFDKAHQGNPTYWSESAYLVALPARVLWLPGE